MMTLRIFDTSRPRPVIPDFLRCFPGFPACSLLLYLIFPAPTTMPAPVFTYSFSSPYQADIILEETRVVKHMLVLAFPCHYP
jgi:hypothetical protein